MKQLFEAIFNSFIDVMIGLTSKVVNTKKTFLDLDFKVSATVISCGIFYAACGLMGVF
jgi:hypothetical protein